MPRKAGSQNVRCTDQNGQQCDSLTTVQARRLVLDGDAVPCTSSGGEIPGWQGRAWRDWPGIKLIRPKVTKRSSATLVMSDSEAVAGVKPSKYRVARVQDWPLVNESYHGAKATMIQAGCKA